MVTRAKTTSKKTTKMANRGGTSTAARKMSKGSKGAAGSSKAPKTVARPSGGTKTGGGKPAGGRRGC